MSTRNFLDIFSITVLATLGGCFWEKGFEYKNNPTELQPLDNGNVGGTVIMGYGVHDPRYRIRVKLHGLKQDRMYYMHFVDSKTCGQDDLANSRFIDQEWGLHLSSAVITGNIFGIAKPEFRLVAPRHFFDFSQPQVLPTVVITVATASESNAVTEKPVACGNVSSHPSNRQPHM